MCFANLKMIVIKFIVTFLLHKETTGFYFHKIRISSQDLDGIWKFRMKLKGRLKNLGIRQSWFNQTLEQTGEVELMAVPSSYQDLSQDRERMNFLGWAWYQSEFWVPAEWNDNARRILIRFGSVHYNAMVWINGIKVVEHKGGHLPFQAELTSSQILFDKPNVVTVAVNNTLTPDTVPQGFLTYKTGEKYPPNHFIMESNFDFFNYAGIHRSVVLYTTPRSYIDDITVTTGSVTYSIVVVTEGTATVSVTLRDKEGAVAAQGSTASGTLQVPNAKLWWPYTMVGNASDAGYLYSLEVRLRDGTSNLEDVYRLKIGIRSIKWSDTSFTINDRPFYFAGFGRHEDFFIRGRGYDPVLLVKDHNLIKWVGASAYRTTHYPYSEELMDMADQLGIVIIDECPAVSLTLFGPGLLETHKNELTRLIKRDKNRPSVVMWSVANEPRSEDPNAENYFREVFQHTRSLDSSRPVTIVLDTNYARDLAAQFTDILCLNRYHAWYNDQGELEMIVTALSSEAQHWMDTFQKPMIVTEYGADTIAGLHTSPSWLFTEEFQEDYMREHFKVFDKLRTNSSITFIGEMIWNFADFMTKQEIRRVVGNKKGIFTRDRQPKASAHLLRSRYHLLANEQYGYPIPDDLHQLLPVYIPTEKIANKTRNLPEMPCGPILELHGQRKRFHIPYGLKPLMEDMTMEVLKEQPPDVLEFLASFLEERVRNRQTESHSRRKSWLVHRWSWEASSLWNVRQHSKNLSNHSILLWKKLIAAYRGFHTREVVKESKGYAHNNGRVSVEITDDNLSEEIPDEGLLEVENEDDEQDGVVLFHSDAEETPEEEEEGSSGLEEARIYSALDSATEEEEESVTGDEMAVIDAVEDSKVGLEIDENEEEEEEDEQYPGKDTKNVMDFLHCQQCGHWPRFQPGNHQRYFMTSCGHLYCQTCLNALSDKCPSCQGECRIQEVNGQSSEDVRAHFLNPLAVLRDSFKKPMQILQFQYNQQKDCVRIYGKIMEAYNRSKHENAALKAELLRLKQSYEELRQQNQQLQMQGKGLDLGSRTMAFPTPTPSQHSETINRSGNDVLNLFREPTPRPNVQPQVMVAPLSCNPSQSARRVHAVSSQMSANKRPAYSVGFQNLNPQQSPITSLFGTPATSTPQYLIPGSENAGNRSAQVTGYPSISINRQQFSVTTPSPSQTPELISRLRNLKCNLTPNLSRFQSR
ncbi:Beta-glucuronidase [Orchesella cincta]|uniref:Beta-glucuronidase n=1 Tax=Orchesella cincta TaxID=48709 RepID=A0A1D2NN07_ORCCI|nr:Beta-glucuronidase [Orchesella cincta]